MNKNTTKSQEIQPLSFSFLPNLVADFKGGQVSSDGGLLLLREFDKKVLYVVGLNKCIEDPRNPLLVIHEQEELLRQRLFQIILGYEDADDSDLLRHDPLFQLTVKKPNKPSLLDVEELASQPTMCRIENRVLAAEIIKINNFLTDNYIKSRKERPTNIIIDFDSTDDPTHGHQQLSMFHGYYEQTMYHPLLISEGHSQLLLGVFLRPGNVHTAHDILPHLTPLTQKLKEAFVKAKITLRADAGFSSPKMYQFCEKQGFEYAIGIATNNVLRKQIKTDLAKARKQFKKNKKEISKYVSFKYRAKSWQRQCRIIAKIEITEHGESIRFVATSLKGRAGKIYQFYGEKGNNENCIKEFKNGFKADRLSCQNFSANYFRLLLHACAYNFIVLFKSNFKKKDELRETQIDTLRIKLFKVGAWIKETTRKIWVHISSAWPFRGLFQEVYLAIRGSPAYSLA